MSDRKVYLHIINLAPSTPGALVDLTVELELYQKLVIGRYTLNKTLAIATGPQPEGIVNPPETGRKKPEVKKIGLDIHSVSRNHGTFSRAGDEAYYQDHSTYGTEYYNHSSKGPGKALTKLSNEMIKIAPGDVLYFGRHTPETPFKYCITFTRRDRHREK
jgi:hypothetical protein